jgi:hypothetical protein
VNPTIDPRIRSLFRTRLSRAAPVLAMVVLCCPALVACGSSSSSTSSAAAAGGSGAASNRNAQQVKFAECMRQHGVPITDPARGVAGALSSGVPASTLQAAVAACRQYAVGASGAISETQRAQFTRAFVKYATCLRANGIDISDPTENGTNGFGQKLLAAEALPNFQQANAKCRRNLPAQFAGAASSGR